MGIPVYILRVPQSSLSLSPRRNPLGRAHMQKLTFIIDADARVCSRCKIANYGQSPRQIASDRNRRLEREPWRERESQCEAKEFAGASSQAQSISHPLPAKLDFLPVEGFFCIVAMPRIRSVKSIDIYESFFANLRSPLQIAISICLFSVI